MGAQRGSCPHCRKDTNPRPFPEPLGGSPGLSSPGGHLTIRRGLCAHGGCLLDPPPRPHAQAPAPRLRHLDLDTRTPQARHCRPRTLSSADGVVIQLEIRRERSFTSPWWESLEKWAGGGAQGRGRNPGGRRGPHRVHKPPSSSGWFVFLVKKFSIKAFSQKHCQNKWR